MPTLDRFESFFKSATKERFHLAPVELSRVMIVTGLQEKPAPIFHAAVKKCFANVLGHEAIEWLTFDRDSYQSVAHLLEIIAEKKPDLICTYRNLYTPGKIFPFSLGTYLDVLTQAIDVPILVTPRPNLGGILTSPLAPFKDTLVVTDHLTGADRLVSWGVRFTAPSGRLTLAHVEDDATFERYIDAFSKIPAIDTATARETLKKQLLKEPTDYVQSCRDLLNAKGLPISGIESVVKMGHRVEDFRSIISSHEIELVVFNTKDEDQLAMHGLAFPLAVELRDLPLLML